MSNFIKRLYSPEFFLKPHQRTSDQIPPTKDVYGTVFRIAWPSVTEAFLIAIIGMVDTVMVSSLGTYAISAVGLVTQPRMLIICMFMALNIGVTAVCARRFGQKRQESAKKCLRQCLFLESIISIIVVVIVWQFAEGLMKFSGAQPDTLEPATIYFKILLIGIPFNIMTMTINAAQRGVGATKMSMITNIVANGVNVVFNYLLISGNFGFPRLEVAGAAIATSLGYVVSFVVALISVLKPGSYIRLEFKKSFLPDKETMSAIVKVSNSAMLEQLFMRVGFFTFAKIIASLGTVDFAAHQVGLNMLHISFSFGDGLSVASSALIGQSLGRKRQDMAIVYGKACQRIGVLCLILIALTCITLRRPLVMIFSEDPVIIEKGMILLLFVVYIAMVQISTAIYAGSLRSAGDTFYVSIMAMICIGILRPVLSHLLCNTFGFGLYGAWTGMAIDQTCRVLILSLRFATGKWTKIEV